VQATRSNKVKNIGPVTLLIWGNRAIIMGLKGQFDL
jgi:hypothetical protein